MALALLSVVFAGGIAVVLVVGGMSATARVWVGREHLGMAFGIASWAGASWVAFLAWWVHPVLGTLASVALVAAAVLVAARARAWRYWRSAAPVLGLVVGIVVVYVGLTYLWHGETGAFTLAEARFTDGMLPPDNAIPHLLEDAIASGRSTHGLIGDWNGSDRPPLQAGFLLLVRAFAAPLAGADAGAFGGSVVAQAMWIPALYALLRAVRASTRASTAGVLLAATMGTSLVNTIYTWPKMLSAALVIAACVFLIEARRDRAFFRPGVVLASISVALALLAHGAAAFAAPLIVALAIAAMRGKRGERRAVAATIGWAGVAALLTYAPWLLYARFADPPGDRLVKWHLAGVIPADDPRSFLRALVDSYRDLTFTDWVAGRWTNLTTAFNLDPTAGVRCWCSDALGTRQSAEFFTTTTALGVVYPLVVVAMVAVLVRRLRRRALRGEDRLLLSVVWLSLASIALWCLAMFIPGSTLVHQGSQVWLLLLAGAAAVWLERRAGAWVWGIVGFQALATLVVYAPGNDGHRFSAWAALVMISGAAVGVAGIRLRATPVADDGPQPTSLVGEPTGHRAR